MGVFDSLVEAVADISQRIEGMSTVLNEFLKSILLLIFRVRKYHPIKITD